MSPPEVPALPPAPAPEPRGTARPWVILSAALLLLLGAGVAPRLERQQALDRQEAESKAPPRVAVAQARRAEPRTDLTLPGTALPALSTTLYARLNGFVRRIHVDLGDTVREGQVLAELEAPELEAELQRARARVDEATRNFELAQAAAQRHERLAQAGISSREAADEARARANSAEATLKSARAEVERLAALYAYHRVVAPFDGVITRRSVERGALVTAGSGAGVTSLFELAQTRLLKVYVDVPQSLAQQIHAGMEAELTTNEAPDQVFRGRVVRTAGALDPSTRTLRTEIQLPNEGGLLAGSFVRVRLAVERKVPPVVVPASALAVRQEGPHVLVVDESGAVQRRLIVLGRDLGPQVEVLAGLSGGERIVLSPPDELRDGATVRVAETSRAL